MCAFDNKIISNIDINRELRKKIPSNQCLLQLGLGLIQEKYLSFLFEANVPLWSTQVLLPSNLIFALFPSKHTT
ncbi:hypothetical protein A0J61_03412 [Choanephora cucurbitarum]|uniref:Uncharacterized protein n=1 Tax=Choanephora cucurbitarum TaxID=101091 RepID=A0A1C7NHD4_9FUNG|nr:hypothetical protein A0J61_03412 [Choanephora cucurbitarum]